MAGGSILDGAVKARPLIAFKDTKSNIETLSSVVEGSIAYATDTEQIGRYDGVGWLWGPGLSNTIIVAKGGGDHTTISAAVSAATSGDVIILMPGTYDENVTVNTLFDLTIVGLNAEYCIINGQVRFYYGGAIQDVTVYLDEDYGGTMRGIYHFGFTGTFTVRDCIVDITNQNSANDATGIESAGSGTYTWVYNSRVSVSVDGSGEATGLKVLSSGNQTALYTYVEADDYDLYESSATLKVGYCQYDPSKVYGTPTYLAANEILTALKTVDGSGSGLDADTVDGAHADNTPAGNEVPILTAGGDLDLRTSGRHIYIAPTRDIARPTTGQGIFDRIADHGIDAFDHFTGGSIPTGFSWLSTTGFGGTPAVLDYDQSGDYMICADSTADEYFLAKTITGWGNKNFWARVSAGQNQMGGIRIDNGYGPSDTDNERYMRIYAEHSGYGGLYVKAAVKDTSGSPTVVSSAFIAPFDRYFVFRAYCYGTGSPWAAFFYLVGEEGLQRNFWSRGSQTWTPSRIGLFFESPGSQQYLFVDWFYHNFT